MGTESTWPQGRDLWKNGSREAGGWAAFRRTHEHKTHASQECRGRGKGEGEGEREGGRDDTRDVTARQVAPHDARATGRQPRLQRVQVQS